MQEKSVGIIGLGSFGKFAASLVPKHCNVIGFDPNTVTTDIEQRPLEEVVKSDILINAAPLSAYQELLPQIGKLILSNTLFIDICSVKVVPEQLIAEHLPNHPNLLITHPLFGPQSAQNGTAGHRFIVCKEQGEQVQTVLNYCEQELGLDIHRMSSEEHDRIMARVHARTFFLARGLTEVGTAPEEFMTPSYQKLIDLAQLDQTHTEELFTTIEQGNPFAKEAREELIRALQQINDDLA